MRLRRKPWARPELAACPFFVDDPQQIRGNWCNLFARPTQPVHMELGCGKGGFLAQLASGQPNINYLGLDIKSEVLVLAKRKVEAAYAKAELPVDNVFLMSHDIERLHLIFTPEEKVERIYINFCNPWPKESYHKHRLTHTRQLEQYRKYLRPGGQLWFKTDDDPLFEDTLGYLQDAKWDVKYITRDLHQSSFEHNVVTEHEAMFSLMGIPIKFVIAEPMWQ